MLQTKGKTSLPFWRLEGRVYINWGYPVWGGSGLGSPNYPYRSPSSLPLVFLILSKSKWYVGCLGITPLT